MCDCVGGRYLFLVTLQTKQVAEATTEGAGQVLLLQQKVQHVLQRCAIQRRLCTNHAPAAWRVRELDVRNAALHVARHGAFAVSPQEALL